MGGGIIGKPKGPTAEQRRLQREQAALAEQQRIQMEEEKVRLAEQEKQAKITSDRERTQRISERRAIARRQTGRGSLIKTSELGVSDTLG